MRYIVSIAVALLLAGCASAPVGSVAGGDCKIAHTPTYAVKGKTTYDQGWVDDTTEALVRGCKQARPAKRPAALDAAVVAKKSTPAPVPVKLKWWHRLGK